MCWMNGLAPEVDRRWYVESGWRVPGDINDFRGSLGSPVASGEWPYGVAVIVSQDSGFGSAVELGENIAKGQGRQIVFESSW